MYLLILSTLLSLSTAFPAPAPLPQVPSPTSSNPAAVPISQKPPAPPLPAGLSPPDSAADPAAGACAPVAVLFARGTTEIPPFGETVGPPFMAALKTTLPAGTTFYGVQYPADIPGFLVGGSPMGIQDMKSKAESIVAKCPSTKLVMSGYSQGAQVAHKALSSSNDAVKQQTGAVVFYGDPLKGQAVAGVPESKIATFCMPGDTICDGTALITPAHLAYAANVGMAVGFVKAQL